MKIIFLFYNENMLDVRKTIGNRIKESRKRQQMTQAELAFAVGVAPKYISRIETGIAYPSLSVIEKIFNILNIEINIQTNDILLQDTEEDRIILLEIINSKLQNTSLKNIKIIKDIVSALTTDQN